MRCNPASMVTGRHEDDCIFSGGEDGREDEPCLFPHLVMTLKGDKMTFAEKQKREWEYFPNDPHGQWAAKDFGYTPKMLHRLIAECEETIKNPKQER